MLCSINKSRTWVDGQYLHLATNTNRVVSGEREFPFIVDLYRLVCVGAVRGSGSQDISARVTCPTILSAHPA